MSRSLALGSFCGQNLKSPGEVSTFSGCFSLAWGGKPQLIWKHLLQPLVPVCLILAIRYETFAEHGALCVFASSHAGRWPDSLQGNNHKPLVLRCGHIFWVWCFFEIQSQIQNTTQTWESWESEFLLQHQNFCWDILFSTPANHPPWIKWNLILSNRRSASPFASASWTWMLRKL